MVQILPRKISAAEGLLTGLASGANDLVSQFVDRKAQDRQNAAQLSREAQIAALKAEYDRQSKLELLREKQNLQNEQFRNLFGKEPGLQSQPTDHLRDDRQKLLQQGVPLKLEEPSNASPIENLSDEQITQLGFFHPQLAQVALRNREMKNAEKRHSEDMALKQKEFDLKQKKESPEFSRDKKIAEGQAQADLEYSKKLEEELPKRTERSHILQKLDQLTDKNVTGKPYEKILEQMGLITFTSEGRREYSSLIKNLLTDMRTVLGSQFSQNEFFTILNSYPSADFTPEANKAIISNLKDAVEIKNKEYEIAQKIKKDNGGNVPKDFQSQVNQKTQEFAAEKVKQMKQNTLKIMNEQYGIGKDETLMFSPNGDPMSIPSDQVEFYLQKGATMP